MTDPPGHLPVPRNECGIKTKVILDSGIEMLECSLLPGHPECQHYDSAFLYPWSD